jgi:hypothetical protein
VRDSWVRLRTVSIRGGGTLGPQARISRAYELGRSDRVQWRLVLTGAVPQQVSASDLLSANRAHGLLYYGPDSAPFWSREVAPITLARVAAPRDCIGRAFPSETELLSYFCGAGIYVLPQRR